MLPTVGGPHLVQAPPDPEQTAENFRCLVGPCRHYWHMVTDAQEGNPEGTFAAPLRQRVQTCTRGLQETDITGRLVWSCSGWSPRALHRVRLLVLSWWNWLYKKVNL